MRLVGYIRVSTDRQAEEGFGLSVQQDAIERWTAKYNHELVTTTKDEGVSGTVAAEDRPGLADALDLISTRNADGIVVARLDRLARSLAVQEAALAHVWKHDGLVFAVDCGPVMKDDPDDPMRTALRLMIGVFGQLERSMISARLRAGRQMKARQGGYAFGSPGFGYSAEDGELTPNGTEQVVLARMTELRRSGHSLREICRILDSEGHRPKRCGRWHPQSVTRILAREGVRYPN